LPELPALWRGCGRTMRISLNLATRPFADLGPAIKRLRIAMGVLVLVSVLLVLGLHAIHQKAEAARALDREQDAKIETIANERKGYEELMRQPDNAQLLKQAAVLNKIIDDKAFSWTLAMEDLETVLPGGVQVTSLEPARQKDGHITLHLRVMGPRNRAVDLVRNLEHSRRFLLPRIVGENAAESNDRPGQRMQPVSAEDRVDFDVLAEYNAATAGERKANRKQSSKTNESGGTVPARHSVRPLPLNPRTQGRPPYAGSRPTQPPPVPRNTTTPANRLPSMHPKSTSNQQPGGPQ
jgi:type IV pilus assembly protein PilN